MEINDSENWTITDLRFYPIAREYAKRIKLVDTINHMTDSQMELSPGDAIMAMVMDTFSGRTPLYRLTESLLDQDTELIIGKRIEPELFNDTNLGRAMDKIYEVGAHKIFSQISQNAIGGFGLDTMAHHFDTTSVSVFGDYDFDEPPLLITYGHSKAKRPDLKQFMISMCCVERNIPIIGKTEDGNSSDKTLNNEVLSAVSAYMKKNGISPGASIYVADSAFVTGPNLGKSTKNGVDFLSRLPANFKECGRVIEKAVLANKWSDIGTLGKDPGSSKRPLAHYRSYESTVTIDDNTFRAVVIHSSAYDKRRQKSVENKLKADKKELEKTIKTANSMAYQCHPDAVAAGNALSQSVNKSLHKVNVDVVEVPRYGRGRPKQGEPRTPKRIEYTLNIQIEEDKEKTESLRLKAGCFVLITNVPLEKEDQKWTACDLLKLYKEQDGIEKNFGFLKDPAIINAVFLKKTSRIEVLGLILLLALLIWRLIERDLRLYVKDSGESLPGWRRRMTKSPTSFMMSTKFLNIPVVSVGGLRKLAKPLNEVQLKYLEALNLTVDIYTSP